MLEGFYKAQQEYEHKMFDPFDGEEDEQQWGEPDYYKEWIENDR